MRVVMGLIFIVVISTVVLGPWYQQLPPIGDPVSLADERVISNCITDEDLKGILESVRTPKVGSLLIKPGSLLFVVDKEKGNCSEGVLVSTGKADIHHVKHFIKNGASWELLKSEVRLH